MRLSRKLPVGKKGDVGQWQVIVFIVLGLIALLAVILIASQQGGTIEKIIHRLGNIF